MSDHPHTDPGDGRSECDRCGKWIWPVTHSCKGVPVTEAAKQRYLREVRAALQQLDGTPEAAVSLITGIPVDELEQYGGVKGDGRGDRK